MYVSAMKTIKNPLNSHCFMVSLVTIVGQEIQSLSKFKLNAHGS